MPGPAVFHASNLPPPLPIPSIHTAYRGATQWRMCFALAAKAGWPPEQQRRLAAGLAEELAVQGRALEAAQLTLQHLGDTDSAGAAGRGGRRGARAQRLRTGMVRWAAGAAVHTFSPPHPLTPLLPVPTVLLLAQGKEWREALRCAYAAARPDLVDTLVAPQAAAAAAAALEGERLGSP